jgi:hypothetical protein
MQKPKGCMAFRHLAPILLPYKGQVIERGASDLTKKDIPFSAPIPF